MEPPVPHHSHCTLSVLHEMFKTSYIALAVAFASLAQAQVSEWGQVRTARLFKRTQILRFRLPVWRNRLHRTDNLCFGLNMHSPERLLFSVLAWLPHSQFEAYIHPSHHAFSSSFLEPFVIVCSVLAYYRPHLRIRRCIWSKVRA